MAQALTVIQVERVSETLLHVVNGPPKSSPIRAVLFKGKVLGTVAAIFDLNLTVGRNDPGNPRLQSHAIAAADDLISIDHLNTRLARHRRPEDQRAFEQVGGSASADLLKRAL